jgi:hypothetical protein
LLDKIDNVIFLLANRCGLTVDDYVTETGICNVLKTCKLQCLSFMYNVMHNLIYVPYLNATCNNLVHSHNTLQFCNVHVLELSSIDKRNFHYHSLLYWNECPLSYRLMTRSAFMRNCKLHL